MAERITTTKPPKLRVSAKVRLAIEKMVDHALSRAEAAQLSGLTDHALYCALRKPHVQAYRHERMEVLRSSEASRTISRAATLADTAESEHVRLQANTWLAGIDGISPVERTESLHIHSGTVPGLTINLMTAPTEDRGLVDVTPAPVVIDGIGRPLPRPVPHPSQRRDGQR